MLATANFSNRLFWAVLIGWIMSVVLHEFAHGLVAYMGGDYTIRERGGLTLNPLQYVDPVFSILLPIVFLFMGGIPLPGGSTFVRRDLLRSRTWNTAVSLAGPATNLLLFFACALPLHPRFGWLDIYAPTGAQTFLGAMALLQIVSVVFNLFPIPPLDGFQAISPWMPAELRQKVSTPPLNSILMIVFFLVVFKSDLFLYILRYVMDPLLNGMGFGDNADFFRIAFVDALFK